MVMMVPIAARGRAGQQAVTGVTVAGGVAQVAVASAAGYAAGQPVFASASAGAGLRLLGLVSGVVGNVVGVRVVGAAAVAVGEVIWWPAAWWRASGLPSVTDWGQGRDEGVERLETTGGVLFTRTRAARESVRLGLARTTVADWQGWRGFLAGQADGGLACFTAAWADKDTGGVRVAKVRVEAPDRELSARVPLHGLRSFEVALLVVEEGVYL